jgi:hypothetical protein
MGAKSRQVQESENVMPMRQPQANVAQKRASCLRNRAAALAKCWLYITPEEDGKPRVYGMTPEVMRYFEQILEKWGQRADG